MKWLIPICFLLPVAFCNVEIDYVQSFKYFINNVKTVTAKFTQNNVEWHFFFCYFDDIPCMYMVPENDKENAITVIDDLLVVNDKVYDVSGAPFYSIICKKVDFDKLNCTVERNKNMISIKTKIYNTEVVMYCSLYKNGNIEAWRGWQISEPNKKTITAIFNDLKINDKTSIPQEIFDYFSALREKYKKA